MVTREQIVAILGFTGASVLAISAAVGLYFVYQDREALKRERAEMEMASRVGLAKEIGLN